MKCIACGSEAMIEGTVRENGGGAELRFYPRDRSLLKQLLFLVVAPEKFGPMDASTVKTCN